MKIINVLLMGLLTCLVGGSVKADCPSGFTCVCDGQCAYSCPDESCPPEPSCSCSSVNLPFVPQPGVVYTFSSETYFICDSSEDLRPILLQDNVYTCSINESTLAQPKLNQKRHIRIDSSVIYKFPEEMTFKCDKTPVVVNKGLPSQYYTCPVASSNKLKDQEVDPNK